LKNAIIQDGKVVNIIEVAADTAFGLHLPSGQFTTDCGAFPVAIGDDFIDGVFSRGGNALTPVPTDAQRIAQLEAENAMLRQDSFATMQALAEVYELMTGGGL
jgi:hypothetical protein